MIWIKLVSNGTFSSATGADKDWPLPVQDWGLKIAVCQYVIFVTTGTAAVKIGALHKEGPNTESTYFLTHSTPIALAAQAAAPVLIKGKTDAGIGPLMPYFTPVIRVGTTGAGVDSFTGDVWVGGKPY